MKLVGTVGYPPLHYTSIPCTPARCLPRQGCHQTRGGCREAQTRGVALPGLRTKSAEMFTQPLRPSQGKSVAFYLLALPASVANALPSSLVAVAKWRRSRSTSLCLFLPLCASLWFVGIIYDHYARSLISQILTCDIT